MNLKYYLRGLGIGILVTAMIMGFTLSGSNERLSDAEIVERAKELGMIENNQVLADLETSEASAVEENAGEAEPDRSNQESGQEQTDEPLSDGAMLPTNEATPEALASPNQPVVSPPTVSPHSTMKPVPTVSSSTAMVSPSASPAVISTPTSTIPPIPTPLPTAKATASPSRSVLPGSSLVPSSRPENGGEITFEIHSGDSSVSISQRLEEAGLVPSAAEYDRYLCDNNYDKRLRVGTYQVPMGADEATIAEIITSAT